MNCMQGITSIRWTVVDLQTIYHNLAKESAHPLLLAKLLYYVQVTKTFLHENKCM